MTVNIRIGALISGGGSNLAAIMDSCRSGKVNGSVVFAGSDKPGAAGLSKAAAAGAETFVVDYRKIIADYDADPAGFKLPSDFDYQEILEKQSLFGGDANPEKVERFIKTRVAAEAMILEKMKKFQIDLLVLAGFMRTLTPYFIERVNKNRDNQKIMNIHPALLPAFPGVDGYGDTFRYGCRVGGCTVHFIDGGMDTGPIIGQKAYSIAPHETLDDIKKKGLALEWELYSECVQLYAQKRLSVEREPSSGRSIVRILPEAG